MTAVEKGLRRAVPGSWAWRMWCYSVDQLAFICRSYLTSMRSVVILDLHHFASLPPESPSSLKNGLGGRSATIYSLNACTWAGKNVGTGEERFKFVEVKLVNVTLLLLIVPKKNLSEYHPLFTPSHRRLSLNVIYHQVVAITIWCPIKTYQKLENSYFNILTTT